MNIFKMIRKKLFQNGVCIQYLSKDMKNESRERERERASASISESIECRPVQENTNKEALSELQTAHAYLS
jgi:hypothetical protein